MPICGVFGCSNRPSVNKEYSFFKTPKIIRDQGDETLKLSEERRRLWKSAVNRKYITTEEKWERTIVCSKHFVDGMFVYFICSHMLLNIITIYDNANEIFQNTRKISTMLPYPTHLHSYV